MGTESLRSKKCVSCEGGLPPLTTDRAVSLLSRIAGWKLDGEKIVKEFTFKNFAATIAFVNKVAALAEQENHHPDLFIHDYRKLTIALSTHAAKGLTENDFILAAKIDAVSEDLYWDQKARTRAKTFVRKRALSHQAVWGRKS